MRLEFSPLAETDADFVLIERILHSAMDIHSELFPSDPDSPAV
jgi:plasmid stabilization system protein ParE